MWKHDQNNMMPPSAACRGKQIIKYKEEISSKTATKVFGDSGLFGKD
jgi:hypothetical protein